MVCDREPSQLERLAKAYPTAKPVPDFAEVLDDPTIDAVAIATPIGTHAKLALAALDAGKHVLVEKPMASSVHDAEEMVRRAEERGQTLMVDHTYVYSNAVRKIKDMLDAGELGDLYFVDSVRINLGLFQHDVNVVWDLAPHDLSIMDYLVGRLPRSLSAFGACHADNEGEIEDVAYLNLDFGRELLASFHVNWLSPVKVRHFILGGSRKSIVYNDLESVEKIKVYDSGVTISHNPEARRQILVDYRTGDVWSPHISGGEPLQAMVRHFAECVQEGKRPLTDGETGLRIVRILEAAQRSIKAQGGRITLSTPEIDRSPTASPLFGYSRPSADADVSSLLHQ
jgi:predicted dehydrogenase